MRPSSSWTDRLRSENGSASLEFITVGVVLLVPLIYLIFAMASIQAAALAAEGAARQAARVFVLADSPTDAVASAERAVDFALADHGVDGSAAQVTIVCTPDPANCLTRQALVEVRVALTVALPLMPPVLIGDFPLAVPIDATATQQVSRFWTDG